MKEANVDKNRIVAIVEIASPDAGSICFVNEFPLIADKELCYNLLAHRESGFPHELSYETLQRMKVERVGSKLHSWIRLFGLQVAYQRYCEQRNAKEDVKKSMLALIQNFNEILRELRQGGKIPEPRLIFWFERVES